MWCGIGQGSPCSSGPHIIRAASSGPLAAYLIGGYQAGVSPPCWREWAAGAPGRRAGEIMQLRPRSSRRTTPGQLGGAARAVAQRAPETITVVRYRAQPTLVTIVRLTATAVFAYLLALLIPGVTPRPVLAPLT